MLKKSNIFLFSVICIAIIFMITAMSCAKSTDTKIQTNLKLLSDRFPEFITEETATSCCYTADKYSSYSRIGPDTYHMEGCVKLTDSELKRLLSEYDFSECEVIPSDKLSPFLSEYSNVKWHYSKELSYDITKSNFVGKFYLDTANGIYYFEVDSN